MIMRKQMSKYGKYICRADYKSKGRKYIYFRVRLPIDGERTDKFFKTLEEAKQYRDEMAQQYDVNLTYFNKYEIRGSETVIFLNHKGKKLETVIDTEDLEKVKKYGRWCANNTDSKSNRLYVQTSIIDEEGMQKKVYLHRVICPAPEGMEVDHIDWNTKNQKKSNLRVVTREENLRHKRPKSMID